MSWLKEDFDLKTSDNLIFEETFKTETSIMDLLHLIADRYPKFGKNVSDNPKQDFFDYCLVILNRKIITNPAEVNTELKEGDNVKRGQKFGLICFVSRLDIYLPLSFNAHVSVGEKVKAGRTILGYFS